MKNGSLFCSGDSDLSYHGFVPFGGVSGDGNLLITALVCNEDTIGDGDVDVTVDLPTATDISVTTSCDNNKITLSTDAAHTFFGVPHRCQLSVRLTFDGMFL